MQFKKVLIIGGGGYVGVALQEKLLNLGYELRVYDTFWYPDGILPKEIVPDEKRIEYCHGDVRELDKVANAFEGIDACIHLACVSNDPSFELNADFGKSINFEAFRNLVAIINRSKDLKLFIYASSSSVYGVKKELEVTENLTCEPLTDYSKYKLDAELFLKENIRNSLDFVILRPSTVCGFSRRQRFDLVVNAMTISALTQQKIRIDGGTQFRPNLHISDMVNAYLAILEAPTEKITKETFNVAGENLSLNDIAETINNTLSFESELNYQKTIDLRSYRVSGKKIENILNFKPKFNVKDAIRDIEQRFKDGFFGDVNDSKYYNIQTMKKFFES
jgi:nucleoside-diphosphate-sugar epimerase